MSTNEITISLNSANRHNLADSPYNCTIPFVRGPIRDVKAMRISSINILDDNNEDTNFVFIQSSGGQGFTRHSAEYDGKIADHIVLKFQLPGNLVPGSWVSNGMIYLAAPDSKHGATVRDISLRVLNEDLSVYSTVDPDVDPAPAEVDWSFDLTLFTEAPSL